MVIVSGTLICLQYYCFIFSIPGTGLFFNHFIFRMEFFPNIDNVDNEIEVVSEAVAPTETEPAISGRIFTNAFQSNRHLTDVLEKDPTLKLAAFRCLLASKAPGTVHAYTASVDKFQKFCESENLPFPHFTTASVMQYILRLDIASAPFQIFKVFRPALCFLEQSLGLPTAFTPEISLVLEGAMRRASAAAGPVKKAPLLSRTDMQRVLDKLYLPRCERVHLIDAAQFRTLFRLVIVYHSLCRLNCFNHLQAKHFEKVGMDIIVTFPTAKNDQFHQGQQSCLTATDSPYCPVKITNAYFRRFGLQFGRAAGDSSYVNFQLRRSSHGSLEPIRHRPLSATTATENLRQLFAAVGIPATKFTDKSVKMAGVTAAFAAGASPDDVMHAGRWKSSEIPLRYKHNTVQFKRNVAAKIPPLHPN